MPSPFIRFQVQLLRRIAPPVPLPVRTVYDGKSKLQTLLGPEVLQAIRGKTVLDFGSGHGLEAIEMAKAGAGHVIGVEIEENLLALARENARLAGVAGRCTFTSEAPDGAADIVISLDSFEHFDDPEKILRIMHRMLSPNGRVFISWGPPWYHPYGMHLSELYPWTHVVFSEEAVLRWRQLMRGGHALRYREVGLNQLTVARFLHLIDQSDFHKADLRVFPIRPLRWMHTRLTREFTTSIVQCWLEKPA